MGHIIDRVLSVALTVAALILVGVLVRRETRKPAAAERPAATFHADWPELVESGHRMGRDGAPIVLIEFADFECPYCRRFSANLGPLKEEYGTSLAVVFIHFPLAETHRFAIPAARAAECADEQGRFPELHDLLFEKQDSLGLKSWDSYGQEAGIPDVGAFTSCLARPGTMPMIEKGIAAAKALGVTGIPSVMVNGWLYRGGMSAEALETALRTAAEGGNPR